MTQDTAIDGMEGLEFCVPPLGVEVGGNKTGSSDEEAKHAPTDETSHSDSQLKRTDKAEASRDDPASSCEINEFSSKKLIMVN